MIAPDEYYVSRFFVEEGNRVVMSLEENLKKFILGIGQTWTATYNSTFFVQRPLEIRIAYIIVGMLFVWNVFTNIKRCRNEKKVTGEIVVPAFAIAIIITFIVHYYQHWTGYLESGYLGAYQARYYMPCLPIVAYGACCKADEFQMKTQKRQAYLVGVMCSFISLVLLYADFFFFLSAYYVVN